MLFAEELPTSPIVANNAVIIVICIWTVLVLLGSAAAIIFGVLALRRRPSIESEFATKKEMADGFARVDRDLKALDLRNEQLSNQVINKVDALTSTVNTVFREIERRLGRLEGNGK